MSGVIVLVEGKIISGFVGHHEKKKGPAYGGTLSSFLYQRLFTVFD